MNNNPVERFRITFTSDNYTTVHDGAMVDNIIITGNEIVHTARIASGSYMVTMQTSLGVVTRKVILQ